MYEKLKKLTEQQDWQGALAELERCKKPDTPWTEELAILSATVQQGAGDYDAAFESIRQGLLCNGRNAELYLLLGNHYARFNVNQAYLCYENAEFYAESEEDRAVTAQFKESMMQCGGWHVNPVSIVILSYNALAMTGDCIHSIRDTVPAGSCELVIIDNGSTDGSQQWLAGQEDIILHCNAENMGFPYGCNQGIGLAKQGNDIFLLNNDTVVMPNALFWLRMGLYESSRTGATGSVSNFVSNGQCVTAPRSSLKDCRTYARTHNIPMADPYEPRFYLVGFALLLKREALDEVGLLDVRFTPGNFEDNDMGLRLTQAGWDVLLCKNSFIYHYGHGNGKNRGLWERVMAENSGKLREKWGFNPAYYMAERSELIRLIDRPKEAAFSVLEVGCGLGATLRKIRHDWSNATVKGIEAIPAVAHLGAKVCDILQGDIEAMELPYEKPAFDYIIFGDVLEHLREPGETLKKMRGYLKPGGAILCSIPNILHWSVMLPLLHGKFEYEDSGILDRTHLRFFTRQSILQMAGDCGFRADLMTRVVPDSQDWEIQEFLGQIEQTWGPDIAGQMQTYQYLVRMVVREGAERRGTAPAGQGGSWEAALYTEEINQLLRQGTREAYEEILRLAEGDRLWECCPNTEQLAKFAILRAFIPAYQTEAEQGVAHTIFDAAKDLDDLWEIHESLRLFLWRLEFGLDPSGEGLRAYRKEQNLTKYPILQACQTSSFHMEETGRLLERML